jgi:hypothetical protein
MKLCLTNVDISSKIMEFWVKDFFVLNDISVLKLEQIGIIFETFCSDDGIIGILIYSLVFNTTAVHFMVNLTN